MREYVFLDTSMDVISVISNSKVGTCFMFQPGEYDMQDFALLPERDYISVVPLGATLIGPNLLRNLSDSVIMYFFLRPENTKGLNHREQTVKMNEYQEEELKLYLIEDSTGEEGDMHAHVSIGHTDFRASFTFDNNEYALQLYKALTHCIEMEIN